VLKIIHLKLKIVVTCFAQIRNKKLVYSSMINCNNNLIKISSSKRLFSIHHSFVASFKDEKGTILDELSNASHINTKVFTR